MTGPVPPEPPMITELRRWVDYNSTDLGELGKFIRVKYVHNGIDMMVSRGWSASAPPVEFELERVANAATLITSRPCEECVGEIVVIARWPGSDLPRAVEIRHAPGCPDDVG